MDRGAWQATVSRGRKRVEHDLVTKQQDKKWKKKKKQNLLLYV